MKLLVIETKVVVECTDAADPEEVAMDFGSGYEGAVAHFSGSGAIGVLGTDVTGIRPATDDEEHEYSE